MKQGWGNIVLSAGQLLAGSGISEDTGSYPKHGA